MENTLKLLTSANENYKISLETMDGNGSIQWAKSLSIRIYLFTLQVEQFHLSGHFQLIGI